MDSGNLVYCSEGGNNSQYAGFLFLCPFKDCVYIDKRASCNLEKPANNAGILSSPLYGYRRGGGKGRKGTEIQ